jgi:small subunit ribosomal protein S2
LNLEKLIKAGAHFGHPVSKWNPKFKKFISTVKNGIHIINLDLTVKHYNNAVNELSKIVSSGGNILFVGTKSQAKDAVQSSADNCGMYYITERWLGGTLTNYSTIKKSIRRLKLLEKDSSSIYNNLTKKELGMLEREKLRLADLHRGIKDMRHLPAAIFVVDAKHEKISVSEAKCLGIPTFGIVDTNTDPNVVDFPIPANDDSIKTIQIILDSISNSLIELLGKKGEELENSSDKDDLNDTVQSNEQVVENNN